MHAASDRRITDRTAAVLAGCSLLLLLLSIMLWHQEAKTEGALWSSVEQNAPRSASSPGYHIWWLLSDLGHGLVITALVAALAMVTSSRRLLQDVVFTSVAVGAAAAILKVLVHRVRPHDGGLSWPSGHAAAILALSLACLTRPRLFVATLPVALVVGAARVMHFRHWPSDILAGYGVALLVAAMVLRLPLVLPRWMLEPKGRKAWVAVAVAYLGIDYVRLRVANQALPYRFEVAAAILGLGALVRARAVRFVPSPRMVMLAMTPVILVTHHSWSEDSWIDAACHILAVVLIGLAVVGRLVSSADAAPGRIGLCAALGIGFASENLLVIAVLAFCGLAVDSRQMPPAMASGRPGWWRVGEALSWPACCAILELLEAAQEHHFMPVLMTIP